jgi:SAM-dependent methyltransferase
MTNDVVCPLCHASESTAQETFASAKLISEWRKAFEIDIQDEFRDVAQFHLYRCASCSLDFFKPESVAGSPALYAALQKLAWYYIPQKWEYDSALQDMQGCKKGMEIGCGAGDFLERVRDVMKIPFEGCEQNPAAVEAARRKGLQVYLERSENLARQHPGSYDVVCAFQVLEHVTEPHEFFDAATKLLCTGGKLLLGLPNARSFLRHQFSLLDLPPHHMTRWSAQVLTGIQQRFPLRLVRIAYEPLADYHVDGYVEAYMRALAKRGLNLLAVPRLHSSITRLIRISGVQKYLLGHTIYACYVRV